LLIRIVVVIMGQMHEYMESGFQAAAKLIWPTPSLNVVSPTIYLGKGEFGKASDWWSFVREMFIVSGRMSGKWMAECVDLYHQCIVDLDLGSGGSKNKKRVNEAGGGGGIGKKGKSVGVVGSGKHSSGGGGGSAGGGGDAGAKGASSKSGKGKDDLDKEVQRKVEGMFRRWEVGPRR